MTQDVLAISIPEGIELPGPQTQRLVHFTAQFVFQTSPRLEPEILRQQRAAGSHKVDFLDPSNPFNAYYKFLLQLLREQRDQQELQVADLEYCTAFMPEACIAPLRGHLQASSSTDPPDQPVPPAEDLAWRCRKAYEAFQAVVQGRQVRGDAERQLTELRREMEDLLTEPERVEYRHLKAEYLALKDHPGLDSERERAARKRAMLTYLLGCMKSNGREARASLEGEGSRSVSLGRSSVRSASPAPGRPMTREEAEQHVAELSTTHPMEPPPDLKTIIDTLAHKFVENGRAWEADFRSRESAKPTSKFAFLHPANCYNAYCEWRIAFEWKVQRLLKVQRPLSRERAPAEVPLSQQQARVAEIRELKRRIAAQKVQQEEAERIQQGKVFITAFESPGPLGRPAGKAARRPHVQPPGLEEDDDDEDEGDSPRPSSRATSTSSTARRLVAMHPTPPKGPGAGAIPAAPSPKPVPLMPQADEAEGETEELADLRQQLAQLEQEKAREEEAFRARRPTPRVGDAPAPLSTRLAQIFEQVREDSPPGEKEDGDGEADGDGDGSEMGDASSSGSGSDSEGEEEDVSEEYDPEAAPRSVQDGPLASESECEPGAEGAGLRSGTGSGVRVRQAALQQDAGTAASTVPLAALIPELSTAMTAARVPSPAPRSPVPATAPPPVPQHTSRSPGGSSGRSLSLSLSVDVEAEGEEASPERKPSHNLLEVVVPEVPGTIVASSSTQCRLPLEGPRADVPVPGPPDARRHHRSHRRERSPKERRGSKSRGLRKAEVQKKEKAEKREKKDQREKRQKHTRERCDGVSRHRDHVSHRHQQGAETTVPIADPPSEPDLAEPLPAWPSPPPVAWPDVAAFVVSPNSVGVLDGGHSHGDRHHKHKDKPADKKRKRADRDAVGGTTGSQGRPPDTHHPHHRPHRHSHSQEGDTDRHRHRHRHSDDRDGRSHSRRSHAHSRDAEGRGHRHKRRQQGRPPAT